MPLYKKLAYAGSIWSLIQYIPLLVTTIVSSVLSVDIMPIIEQAQPESYYFMSSVLDFGFLTGLVGIIISVIAIIATRKINPMMKRLPIILIIVGVVFLVLQWGAYNFMVGVFNTITADASYYGAAEAAFEDQFFTVLSYGALFGIIPGILLIVSGILAFRIYREPKNPILD